MVDLLKKYTLEELASLYAHVNRWEWPTEILGPAPDYWEEARRTNSKKMNKCKRFTKLFKELQKIVPRELQSRAWCVEILGQTEEEWRRWWDSVGQYSPF